MDPGSQHGTILMRDPVTIDELRRVGDELGLDVVGAAAAPYEDTERHIVERRERGLFGSMRFTMARPRCPATPRPCSRARAR